MVEERARNQEPEALGLEAVMEQHQSALLRYATRLLNNESLAQDVVQEAFIRLHAHWDRVVERGVPFKGWLFRTTHNAAIDVIRKESRRRGLHQRQATQVEPAGDDPEERSRQNEQHAQVLQSLNVLKPKEREVLILRLQEGMTYQEIAAVIQRSEGYVGTLIHSATKKLSQRLRKAGVVS